MANNKKKLIIVAGPTAVGKTSYAIDLAKKNNGSIISCDAIQVYKGLDIGSAKITKEEMQGIKHYLIDTVDFSYDFDIASFVQLANDALLEIYKEGKTPIIVGGTGFYIHALLYGNDFEYENENRKQYLRDLIYKVKEIKGLKFLHNCLKEIDPISYTTIHENNEHRIIRAIEYYMLNNKPISLHNQIEKNKNSKFDFKFYVLRMNRDALYEKINKRVDKMIQQGFLFEIANLIKAGCKKEYRSMQAIGYKELYDFVNTNINKIAYLQKNEELDEIIELIKKNTRNYAKRQETWFRREKNVEYIDI